MTKIMSNSKERLNDKALRFFEDSCTVQEPTVAYRHEYATEAHNESEVYPFMTSCNNDELVNHVLAHEEEYARTGNAVDFLEMMVNFKNEFEWERYEDFIFYHFITAIFPSNLPHITGCWRFPDASTTP